MEVDLQSLFGLHVTWCAQLYSLAKTPLLPPLPRIGTRITRTLLVSKERRHLCVTPCWRPSLFSWTSPWRSVWGAWTRTWSGTGSSWRWTTGASSPVIRYTQLKLTASQDCRLSWFFSSLYTLCCTSSVHTSCMLVGSLILCSKANLSFYMNFFMEFIL